MKLFENKVTGGGNSSLLIGDPNADKTQSLLIDSLRLPLAILVIFLHMSPSTVAPLDYEYSWWTYQGVTNLVCITLSNVISHWAVPFFFLVSGYLYFINVRDFNFDVYLRKTKNRISSLVIPYLTWNVVLALLMLVCHSIFKGQVVGCSDNFALTEHILWDYNRWGNMTGPYDLPLWFLRDLIVISLLSPIVYAILRRAGVLCMVLLFWAYVTQIRIYFLGLSMVSIFYFFLGAYLALKQLNIILVTRKYKHFILAFSSILFVVSIVYAGQRTNIGSIVYPFMCLAGTLSLFVMGGVRNKSIVRQMSSVSFFVYAFHGAPLPFVQSPRRWVVNVIGSMYFLPDIFQYLIAPIVTTIICIMVYVIMRWFLPERVYKCFGIK